VIAEGTDGLLVRFADSAMLAVAIIYLLSNPALRLGFGEAGRRKVLDRYTWPHIARSFRSAYQRAIDRMPVTRLPD